MAPINRLSRDASVTSIEEKKEFILANEFTLANRLAYKILHKHPLSIWMIVIPIVFVYYFYALNRYKASKKDFVSNFIRSRENILDKAVGFTEDGQKPDYEALAEKENIPDFANGAYKEWARALFEHFQKLLHTDGDSYADLVRGKYENRGQYLKVLDHLNKVESKFYKALRKDLQDSVEDAGGIIKAMENSLGPIRREEADGIFERAPSA
jgi:hypothetical protein